MITTPITLNAKAWLELQAQLYLWQWLARYHRYRADGESAEKAYALADRPLVTYGRSWNDHAPFDGDFSDVEPAWNREEWIGS